MSNSQRRCATCRLVRCGSSLCESDLTVPPLQVKIVKVFRLPVHWAPYCEVWYDGKYCGKKRVYGNASVRTMSEFTAFS